MTEYQSVIQRGPATQAEESRERAVIVGVDRPGLEWPLESSLAELERLADTAGADVVASTMQRLDAPNPRTFVGSGKAEEIAELARSSEADLVIFDDELTPSQQANLEKVMDKSVKVIDRTALILDIFALHATSKEGRLQVRLAQNQYLYPRLFTADAGYHIALCHFSHRVVPDINPFFGLFLHIQAHQLRTACDTADLHILIQDPAGDGYGIYLCQPAHIRFRNNIGGSELIDHISRRFHRDTHFIRIILDIVDFVPCFQQFRIDQIYLNAGKCHGILRIADHNHQKPDNHRKNNGNQLQPKIIQQSLSYLFSCLFPYVCACPLHPLLHSYS